MDDALDLDATESLSDARSATSSSDDAPGPTARRPPMKNVSRERMKQETAFLRARVHELERELSRTLAKKALERSTAPSPVWRDLAKRQAARREKSEQERDKLRARLIHQLQVAKSLETIFNNRSGAFLEDLCASVATTDRKTYPVNNLALLHEQFMDEIDRLYPLVDTIFTEAVGLQDLVDSPMRRSTVVSQQTKGEKETLYVELRNAMYVPFPFERVCRAMWRAITSEFMRPSRLVERYRCTDDEYSGTFLSSQNNGLSSDHTFMDSIVMRKFAGENRTVFLWRCANWDRTPGVAREYGDETGWLLVDPMVNSITGQSDGAIVRVCTRYVPIWEVQTKLLEAGALRFDQASAEQTMQVGEVTNRVLNGTEEDIAAISESIENILLDETIGAADDDIAALLDDLETLGGHTHASANSAVPQL